MKAFAAAVAILGFVGASASAKSPFDGRWVQDLDSQSGLSQDEYLIVDGTYSCGSCSPVRSYPADGMPHAIPGAADVTSEAVTITGPRTIVTRIVSPAMTRVTTMTVAPDNKTATYVSIDHRPGVKGPLRTEYLARRTANAPVGAHPVSGTWQGVRYVSVPEQILTIELHESGDRFTYSVPIGVTFTARYGGEFVPVQGPYGGRVLAAVERVSYRQVIERRKEDGKLKLVRTYTVAPDGLSMEVAATNPDNNVTFRTIAHKK